MLKKQLCHLIQLFCLSDVCINVLSQSESKLSGTREESLVVGISEVTNKVFEIVLDSLIVVKAGVVCLNCVVANSCLR